MRQGAIHQIKGGNELVCRIQADLGLETPLLLCAPIIPRNLLGALIPRLHLELNLNGQAHVMLMSELVAIPAQDLGPAIGSAAQLRDQIVHAVDLLVVGF